ncbi:Protein of unknown function DUF3295 [Fusarium oxysporum f. sp. vasinfectum]|nr:Protein of unknown function DUF3295 [Fusarium oxysporum f. sp. vasinfectum]
MTPGAAQSSDTIPELKSPSAGNVVPSKQPARPAPGHSCSSSEQDQSFSNSKPMIPIIKKPVFQIGGSSEEDGPLKSAMVSSRPSSLLSARTIDGEIAEDSDTGDYIDESAIDDDDDSSDWEDSAEEGDKPSMDDKFFQRTPDILACPKGGKTPEPERIVVLVPTELLSNLKDENRTQLLVETKPQEVDINPTLSWYDEHGLKQIDKIQDPTKDLTEKSKSFFPGIKVFKEVYGGAEWEHRLEEIGQARKVFCHRDIDKSLQESLGATGVPMTILENKNWIKEIR